MPARPHPRRRSTSVTVGGVAGRRRVLWNQCLPSEFRISVRRSSRRYGSGESLRSLVRLTDVCARPERPADSGASTDLHAMISGGPTDFPVCDDKPGSLWRAPSGILNVPVCDFCPHLQIRVRRPTRQFILGVADQAFPRVGLGRRRGPPVVGPMRVLPWLACLVALAAALVVNAHDAHAAEPATSTNGGAFFPLDESELGFSVTDDRGMRLWSGWRDLGGENTLGAPVSRRFLLDGWVRQVFERGLLRSDPTRGASLVNVLDFLSARGHDAQLLEDFGIPAAADWSDDEGDGWSGIRARHLALLDGAETWRVALRTAYRTARQPLANNDAAIALYGLPMAVAQTDAGYALRSQRAAWVYDPETDDAPRRIAVLELLQATGLIPDHATAPHRRAQQPPRPVSAVHFFDWWNRDYLPSEFFTHGLTWERIGITREQVGSPAYYDANFRLIRDLGVGWRVLGVVRRPKPDAHRARVGLAASPRSQDRAVLRLGGAACRRRGRPQRSRLHRGGRGNPEQDRGRSDRLLPGHSGGPLAVRRGRATSGDRLRLRFPGVARGHGKLDLVLHRARQPRRDGPCGRRDLRLVGRLPAAVPGSRVGVRALAG